MILLILLSANNLEENEIANAYRMKLQFLFGFFYTEILHFIFVDWVDSQADG